MSPRVSVGLPVYNGGDYLAEAVDSLLGQDFEDFEVILSNNGSTDGTGDVCRRYAARDRRIRYEEHDVNRGAAWNYNHVFATARGDYFKWASHDDLCDPGYLATCVDCLEHAPDSVVLCYPRSILISATGEPIEEFEDRLDLPADDPCARFAGLIRRRRLCNAVFGLHRRDVLGRTRLIGSYFSSDVVLLAELALRGRIVELPDCLFRRRIHAASSCHPDRDIFEVAEWFDPANRGRVLLPFHRLFWEHVRAIRGAPLPVAAKLRCLGILVRAWLPAHSRAMAGELRIAARRCLVPAALRR